MLIEFCGVSYVLDSDKEWEAIGSGAAGHGQNEGGIIAEIQQLTVGVWYMYPPYLKINGRF